MYLLIPLVFVGAVFPRQVEKADKKAPFTKVNILKLESNYKYAGGRLSGGFTNGQSSYRTCPKQKNQEGSGCILCIGYSNFFHFEFLVLVITQTYKCMNESLVYGFLM